MTWIVLLDLHLFRLIRFQTIKADSVPVVVHTMHIFIKKQKLAPRMMLGNKFLQSLGRHMSINLRGR